MKNKIFAAEFIGTFFLLAVVVGSGIMGDRLSNGSVGLALLANSVATGAGLVVLIMMFSSISGAHFNPLVSVAEYVHQRISKLKLFTYLGAQLSGAVSGVIVTHLMFGEVWINTSAKDRGGLALMLSEYVATFGLIMIIRTLSVSRKNDIPFAIGLYITAAYWFTSSTSFVNPAVTIARSLTSTFTGIQPSNILGFIAAQICGAISAEFVFKYCLEQKEPSK